MTVARQHHFLPECYLNGFTRGGGQLLALDLKKRDFYFASPRKLGKQRDFNRVEAPDLEPDALEKALSQFETQLAPALKRICSAQSGANDKDWGFVLNLMSVIAARNPVFRKNFQDFKTRIFEMVTEMHVSSPAIYERALAAAKRDGVYIPSAENVSYEDVKKFVEEKQYTIDFPHGADTVAEFGAQDTVLQLLGTRKWMFIAAPLGSPGFVTCDHPACLSHDDGPPTIRRPVGHAMRGTNFVFPVCRRLKVASISPSAHKPLAAVGSWTALGIPLAITEPTPATREDFTRAHDPEFVDAILECRAMNGFGTRAADVAASLPYTSGAMLSAATEAIRNGQVAVAPTSGFHHAGHSEVAGFCTFNGLMVSALAIKAAGLVEHVGILDFDQHYGDGTDDIIETLGIDFVTHYTAGAHYHSESQASDFLQQVPELVASMSDCDVVLYQAGADPHINDPLGGWLTTQQLAERDRLVFESARQLGIPLAWNLAGGYQSPLRKVLDVHDNTMRACALAYLGDSVCRNQA